MITLTAEATGSDDALLAGGFIRRGAAGVMQDAPAELIYTFAITRRSENGRHPERGEKPGNCGALSVAKLVAFGGRDNQVDASLRDHGGKLPLFGAGAAPGVDQHHEQGEVAP